MIGARKGSPLAVGYGDGEMYLGSDAIALAPFTDTISYLEDGDWAVVTRKGVEVHDANRPGGRARRAQIERVGVPGRQGQPPPFHGEGNPRAARSRRPHARALPRHGQRAGGAADEAAVRFQDDRAGGDLGLRHGLLRRPGRQILVRALRAAAGRDRCRVGVPLPRSAVRSGQSRGVRLAVGRDRRHAGDAALRQGAEAARPLDRQRADLDHRARERRGDADAGRSGDRRRLDQGVHLPARGAALPCHRGRPHPRRPVGGGRAQSRSRHDRGAAPHVRGAAARAADRGAGARSRQSPRTCSISAAAPPIRSRSKAR